MKLFYGDEQQFTRDFKSVIRQFNYYGFLSKRLVVAPEIEIETESLAATVNEGSKVFSHPFFQRGKPELLEYVTRNAPKAKPNKPDAAEPVLPPKKTTTTTSNKRRRSVSVSSGSGSGVSGKRKHEHEPSVCSCNNSDFELLLQLPLPRTRIRSLTTQTWEEEQEEEATSTATATIIMSIWDTVRCSSQDVALADVFFFESPEFSVYL